MKPDCKRKIIVKWLNSKILEFVQMHWMESFAKLNFLDRNVLILEYSVKECHQMIQSPHQAKKDCYIVGQGWVRTVWSGTATVRDRTTASIFIFWLVLVQSGTRISNYSGSLSGPRFLIFSVMDQSVLVLRFLATVLGLIPVLGLARFGDFTTRKVELNQFYMVPQFYRTRSRIRFRVRLTFIWIWQFVPVSRQFF